MLSSLNKFFCQIGTLGLFPLDFFPSFMPLNYVSQKMALLFKKFEPILAQCVIFITLCFSSDIFDWCGTFFLNRDNSKYLWFQWCCPSDQKSHICRCESRIKLLFLSQKRLPARCTEATKVENTIICFSIVIIWNGLAKSK